MEVTQAPGSVGIPLAIAVSAPHRTDTAIAVQRAALPVIALVLMACTMYGTTSTVATVNAAAQTAIQQAAAAANSVTQQLVLGRKTFFLAQL